MTSEAVGGYSSTFKHKYVESEFWIGILIDLPFICGSVYIGS